jgi:hypothetical protein
MSTVIEPVLNGLSIDEWLVSTEEVRQKLFAYARSEPPVDQDTAIQNESEACALRDDAAWYLTQETAKETLAVAKEHSDLASAERAKVVKARVASIQRLVDGLSVVAQTIRSRIYSAMNQNRSRP